MAYVLIGLAVVIGFVGWLVVVFRRTQRAAEEALEHLGFHPCPDQKAWLDETVTGLEGTPGSRCEVRDPRWRAGEPAIYLYAKTRRRGEHDHSTEQQELLFTLKRPSPRGLVLMVKPSSLKSGLATSLVELAATGPWAPQSDGLEKIELPTDLLGSNVMLLLGPRAGFLYDLIDARAVEVLKMLGDCGAMFVQCRDVWCSIGSAGGQTPFDVGQIVTRIGPLLH